MSSIYSESAAHRAAISAAESTRQSAVLAAGSNQSAIRSAEIVYARACLKSALANSIPDASNWTSLLLSLGVQT
jgi:hypothetical protein